MSRILITPRSLTTEEGHPELDRLVGNGHEIVSAAPGRIPNEEELRNLLPACAGWLAGIETIGADLLRGAPELRVIARHGVGLDSVDLEAARECGIAVVPSAGSNAEGVAELVLRQSLEARRPYLPNANIEEKSAWGRTKGTELQGRSAAVIGFGAIGSRVAHLLNAFDVSIRVYDPFATPPDGYETCGSVMDAVRGVDLVTLHCPPTETPLIGHAELQAVAPGATLINTARGSLVDLDAVLLALQSEHLGAYACDVYTTEPPSPHKIWQHPRVLATPHIGGFTVESTDRSVSMAVDALLEGLA